MDPSTLVLFPEVTASKTDAPEAAPKTYWPWDEVSVAVEAIEYDPYADVELIVDWEIREGLW